VRKPPPVYVPLDPLLTDLTAEQACAEGVLQIAAAAKFVGICETSMRALCKSGAVPNFKIKGRRVVPKVALIRYLARHMSESVRPRPARP